MVTGIEKFHEAFADYADNYVIIGGVACAYHESEAEQMPRKTKDIDMILVVEALSDAFVKRFWEFVKAANYADCNRESHKDINFTDSRIRQFLTILFRLNCFQGN